MRRFAHAETDWHDVQEAGAFGRGSCGIQIRTGVKHQFIGADFEFLGWQNLTIGAAIGVCGQAADVFAGLARDAIEVNRQSCCGAAAGCVQNMRCKVS